MEQKVITTGLLAGDPEAGSASLREMLFVFCLLVIVTGIAVVVAEASWFVDNFHSRAVQCLSLILASFKIFLIAEHFMELKHAPIWLRGLMSAWIGLVMLMLIAIMSL